MRDVSLMVEAAANAEAVAAAWPEDARPMVTEMMVTGNITASTNASRIELSNFAYPSYQHLVLALGYVRVGDFPLTNDHIGTMPAKECFTNAYQMAMKYPKRYWYTEGYANYSILAVNHAWLTEKRTGQIVDPTWASLDRKDDQRPIYAGIRFSLEMLCRRTNQTGFMSILGEDWRVDNAAIRYGFTMRSGIAVSGRIK